ncbi:MAG: glycosyl hydrolase family 28-related protein [Phycisphaerales bacterium]
MPPASPGNIDEKTWSFRFSEELASLSSTLPPIRPNRSLGSAAAIRDIRIGKCRQRIIQMARPVYNVKLAGAKGDGVTDDTQVFKRLIASIPNNPFSTTDPRNAGPVIFIPAGTYLISEPLEIKLFSGLEISGEGNSPGDDPLTNPAVFGPRSVLVWTGPTSGDNPLLRLIDIQGLTIKDLGFQGRLPEEEGRCVALINFRFAGGRGNINNTVRNVVFWDADVAILCGEDDEDEGTNSCLLFEMVTFKDCGIGFRVNNKQGVNYLFNSLFASGCDTILDFPFGGSVTVSSMGCTDCGNASGKYAIEFGEGGPNIGPSVITAFRYENVSKLLRVAGDHRLICDGWGQAAAAPGVPADTLTPLIFLAKGGTAFYNSSWQFTQTNAPTIFGFGTPTTGNYCTLSLDRCQFPFNEFAGDPPAFPVTDVILNPNQTNCAWDFHRCDGPGHKPLPDATSGDWNP